MCHVILANRVKWVNFILVCRRDVTSFFRRDLHFFRYAQRIHLSICIKSARSAKISLSFVNIINGRDVNFYDLSTRWATSSDVFCALPRIIDIHIVYFVAAGKGYTAEKSTFHVFRTRARGWVSFSKDIK